MAEVTREATCTWTGTLAQGGGGITSSTSGALDDTPMSFPRRLGPPQGMTSPEELLAAGHATCFAMAMAHGLEELGVPPGRIDVRCAVTLDQGSAGLAITRSDIEVSMDYEDVDRTELERAAADADAGCPYSGLVRGAGGDVRVTVA